MALLLYIPRSKNFDLIFFTSCLNRICTQKKARHTYLFRVRRTVLTYFQRCYGRFCVFSDRCIGQRISRAKTKQNETKQKGRISVCWWMINTAVKKSHPTLNWKLSGACCFQVYILISPTTAQLYRYGSTLAGTARKSTGWYYITWYGAVHDNTP